MTWRERSGDLDDRSAKVALFRRSAIDLEATGETVRRSVAQGPDELEPTERRIAGMAAEGMSNRDVAQALFVTVKNRT